MLVRFLTQDDPEQSRAAAELVENVLSAEQPGFISAVVLAETVWVLRRAYRATRAEIGEVVEGLLSTPALQVEHQSRVWLALKSFRAGAADFSDCLIARIHAGVGCGRTVTFDHRAARLAGFELLPA